MTAPTWMPLHVAAYLADTTHLSTAEHGAYLLLMMHYWQRGGLPDDDAKLARVARLTLKEWMSIRPTIADLFRDGWSHGRIDEELTKAAGLIDQRRNAGKASAERRAQRKSNERSTSVGTVAPAKGQQASGQLHKQEQEGNPTDSPQEPRDVRAAAPVPALALVPEEPKPKSFQQIVNAEFEERFWPSWPNKVGKPKARVAYFVARKRAEADQIMAGLERYVATKAPDRPWLNPATFLNQDRFNDEPAPVAPGREPRHNPMLRAMAEMAADSSDDGRRSDGPRRIAFGDRAGGDFDGDFEPSPADDV